VEIIDKIKDILLSVTGAESLGNPQKIQSLWSGYGSILRVPVIKGIVPSVIVKRIQFPKSANLTDRGHIRKVKSFEVESAWYDRWSNRCDELCRTAKCFGSISHENEVTIILEDLDSAGFPRRSTRISEPQLDAVLSWLAHFHVKFLETSPKLIWPIGTYWHLATRPDELENLADLSLRDAAKLIDFTLNSCRFQTIVHGDAKIDNFCFIPDGSRCAAVDFQYVGGGVGMKDLAYFVGSIFPEWECERRETEILDRYFGFIRSAAKQYHSPVDPEELEQVWRPLYRVAWADFHRFAEGWSPNYWASNGYSRKITAEVVSQMQRSLSTPDDLMAESFDLFSDDFLDEPNLPDIFEDGTVDFDSESY